MDVDPPRPAEGVVISAEIDLEKARSGVTPNVSGIRRPIVRVSVPLGLGTVAAASSGAVSSQGLQLLLLVTAGLGFLVCLVFLLDGSKWQSEEQAEIWARRWLDRFSDDRRDRLFPRHLRRLLLESLADMATRGGEPGAILAIQEKAVAGALAAFARRLGHGREEAPGLILARLEPGGHAMTGEYVIEGVAGRLDASVKKGERCSARVPLGEILRRFGPYNHPTEQFPVGHELFQLAAVSNAQFSRKDEAEIEEAGLTLGCFLMILTAERERLLANHAAEAVQTRAPQETDR